MTEQAQMINLIINGQPVAVPRGTTVYHAAKKIGSDIPIFCYQDRMPPFGACRMCLVEVEKMPKLQTSCTLEASEGMVVQTQSGKALKGQQEIVEFLLINHPLDCPVCDRGGECPLQENTMRRGPGESRFYEQKRQFIKPYALGPVLMLDRERCIACARCTRFGDVVAGDHALEFIERGFKTEVGTPDGGPAESKFIGNTIMICPVGALTSQVYRFRARPWDNDITNSSCTLCPVGCSMRLDSRDGEIVRTYALENRNVNDIWLCDKGWFGYEFVSHPDRLRKPLIRRSGQLEEATWEEAISLVAAKFKLAKSQGKIAGFGGPPLTTEENYLFQKLIREAGGSVDYRIGMPIIEDEGISPGMELSIGECEELSFAALLGVDLTEEFPLIWLRLKQAINKGAKVGFAGHFAPEIAPHLHLTALHAPGKELENIKKMLPQLIESGKKGALFIGRQYLASPNRKAILSELLKVKKEHPHLSLNLLEGHENSMGAKIAGMHPGKGLNAIQVLETSAKSGWDFLYVAGADPAAKFPSKLWKEARANLNFLVVQDLFLTETANNADLVLPTLCFLEKEGTFINIEGRIQKLSPGKLIPKHLLSDAEIFKWIAQKLGISLTMDAVFSELLNTERLPISRPEQIDAQPDSNHASQGKLTATFATALFDHGVRMRRNTKLVQMAKKPQLRVHPNTGKEKGIQNGDSLRLSSNGSSIQAPVEFDKGVAEGTVVIPVGFKEIPAHELSTNLINGMEIEITYAR